MRRKNRFCDVRGVRLKAVCLLLAFLSSAVSTTAAEAPQKLDMLFLTLHSWKGMTFSVNIRGNEVLYRCALYGDESFARWSAYSANETDVNRLFASLKELRMFAWKSEYLTSMMDGEGWYLTFDVNGTRRQIVGSNAQPEEFPAFVDRVALFLGKLPFGFSGFVPHSNEAEDCLRLKQPLRNHIGTAPPSR